MGMVRYFKWLEEAKSGRPICRFEKFVDTQKKGASKEAKDRVS